MEFSTLMTTEVAHMKKSQTKDRIGIPEQREINRNGKVFKGRSRKKQPEIQEDGLLKKILGIESEIIMNF